MITLNLIPEKEKREIRVIDLYIAIKNLTMIFLLTVVVATVIMLITKIILNNYFIKIVTENTYLPSNVNISHGKIKIVKGEMETVQQIQNEYIPWSLFFIRFSRLIPEGVMVTYLEVMSDGGLNISGIARKREHLLLLQDTLKQSGYFKDFTLPYNLIFEKEDIDFDIRLEFLNGKIFAPDI